VTTRHATIITSDAVYLDGERPRLLPGDWAVAGLGALLRRVAARTGTREGVLILDRVAALDLGIPVDEVIDDPKAMQTVGDMLAVAVGDSGWRCRSVKSWTTLRADGLPTMQLGILPWMRADTFGLQVGDFDTDPGATADALGLWWELTGSAYLMSPGVAALRVLQDMVRGGRLKPAWKSEPPCPGVEHRWAPWVRPPMLTGFQEPVTVYDKRRAGLAAAASAEVCIGHLKPTGARAFDRRLAGWWQIEVPAWNDDRLPHPCGPDVVAGDVRWVTTPTLWLLDDLAQLGRTGIARVVNSYTGTGRRLFRYWAQRMEQAWQAASRLESPVGDAVAETVKRGAAREAHGMMAAGTGAIQREDWHHTITAVKRCNMFRAIDRVLAMGGPTPMMVDDDAVIYQHGPVLSLPVGTKLGEYCMENMVL
jgi:hypothetical protein